jgi:hypothetical protein
VEVPLLTEAPKADIVILRREGKNWSDEQQRWLADGLRHTDERHILIEFKYSEGLNLDALRQLNAYDYFYIESHQLKPKEVACFLVVASTPMGDWKSQFGFSATEWPGVYCGNTIFLKRVRVILLNELVAVSHNAPVKCFASRKIEREKAFVILRDSDFMRLSGLIERFITGLWSLFMFNTSTASQVEDLTPEILMSMGQKLIDALLDATPVDEVLNHYKADEVLDHYKPEQRLAGLTEEQVRAYLELLNKK